MATAILLNQIYNLPVRERMVIVERTIHSILADEKKLGALVESDTVQTHYASEQVLAKGWSNEMEDKAWKDL
jgi:hypothetical protein